MIQVRYDKQADALYLSVVGAAPVDRTDQIDEGTLVDIDASGRMVGIEVIRPDRVWAADQILAGYPLEDEDADTLRALFGAPHVA